MKNVLSLVFQFYVVFVVLQILKTFNQSTGKTNT